MPSGGTAARVAVVTDSTAYLPPGTAQLLGVRIVPLQVIVGGHVRAEGVEIDPGEVATVLKHGQLVTTSRPSPTLFETIYQRAFDAGATSIVSIHLSGAMSGTVDAARRAASGLEGNVQIIDSRSVGMGMGFAVVAAAEAAAAGAGADTVIGVAEHTLAATHAFFYVDTLEFLRRGGRIGAAQALVGSALAVKPLLRLHDGQIEPLERVRTASKAIARLEDIAVDCAGHDVVRVAVHHLAAAERAEHLAEQLDARLPKLAELVTCEVGAVVGAHTGPGMLAVVISRR